MKKGLLGMLLIIVMMISFVGCSQSNNSGKDWAKNVEIQVPAKAGGGTDLMARSLGDQVAKDSGHTLTIVNNTDGGGVVAAEKIRTAKADGSTIMQYHSGLVNKIAAGIYDKSITEDFTLIGVAIPVEKATNVFIVPADSEYQTLEAFIKGAKDKPGELMIGVETGGNSHLQSGIFAKRAGIDVKFVEAGSDTEKLTALVGGSIDACFVNPNQAKQYLEAGKITALAVIPVTAEGGRSGVLPDVPDFVEQGVNFNFVMLNAIILGPKGMDPELTQEIHDYYAAAAENDNVNSILGPAGMEMRFLSIEDGIETIETLQGEMNEIIEELGLKQD